MLLDLMKDKIATLLKVRPDNVNHLDVLLQREEKQMQEAESQKLINLSLQLMNDSSVNKYRSNKKDFDEYMSEGNDGPKLLTPYQIDKRRIDTIKFKFKPKTDTFTNVMYNHEDIEDEELNFDTQYSTAKGTDKFKIKVKGQSFNKFYKKKIDTSDGVAAAKLSLSYVEMVQFMINKHKSQGRHSSGNLMVIDSYDAAIFRSNNTSDRSCLSYSSLINLPSFSKTGISTSTPGAVLT